jgi:hypothetical protein
MSHPEVLKAWQAGIAALTQRFSDEYHAKTLLKILPASDWKQLRPPSLYEIYASITQTGFRDGDTGTLPGFPDEQVKEYTDAFESVFLVPNDTTDGRRFTEECWTKTPLEIRKMKEDLKHRQAAHVNFNNGTMTDNDRYWYLTHQRSGRPPPLKRS